MSDGPAAFDEIQTTAPLGGEGRAGFARVQRLIAWFQVRERWVLATAVAFQVSVLFCMILLHAAPYVFGTTILLKVVPVDPRDMFRGDYVVLSYDVNRMPEQGIAGMPQSTGNWWSARRFDDDQWLNDRTIYVRIEPEADGKHWKGTEASLHPPASGLYLKGKYVPSRPWAPLVFGIEAYFVEEGEGHTWEDARNDRKLSAEIAVAPWGQAKLRRLVQE